MKMRWRQGWKRRLRWRRRRSRRGATIYKCWETSTFGKVHAGIADSKRKIGGVLEASSKASLAWGGREVAALRRTSSGPIIPSPRVGTACCCAGHAVHERDDKTWHELVLWKTLCFIFPYRVRLIFSDSFLNKYHLPLFNKVSPATL